MNCTICKHNDGHIEESYYRSNCDAKMDEECEDEHR